MDHRSKPARLKAMYLSTARVEYRRTWKMDAEKAVTALKSSGDVACVFCDAQIQKGDRVVCGEHRIGGKVVGKTIHVESCLSCAREFKALIDLRIGEAEMLK